MSSEVRTCRKCGIEKPVEAFRLGRTICKACAVIYHREASRKWYNEYREQKAASQKEHREMNPRNQTVGARKRRYGISAEEYDALSIRQKGACAICGGPPVKNRKSLSVDHCHETGRIRGLLCGRCNTGLGMFKDLPALLEKALQYLRS